MRMIVRAALVAALVTGVTVAAVDVAAAVGRSLPQADPPAQSIGPHHANADVSIVSPVPSRCHCPGFKEVKAVASYSACVLIPGPSGSYSVHLAGGGEAGFPIWLRPDCVKGNMPLSITADGHHLKMSVVYDTQNAASPFALLCDVANPYIEHDTMRVTCPERPTAALVVKWSWSGTVGKVPRFRLDVSPPG